MYVNLHAIYTKFKHFRGPYSNFHKYKNLKDDVDLICIDKFNWNLCCLLVSHILLFCIYQMTLFCEMS